MINIWQLQDRVVYVSPANPAGNLLADKLRQKGVQVTAIVDNLKHGEGIINDARMVASNGIIIVASGARQREICQSLRLRGFSQAIAIEQVNRDDYTEFRQSKFAIRLKQYYQHLQNRLVQWLARTLPRKRVLYLASGFVDSNVQLMFAAHRERHPEEAVAVLLGEKTVSDDVIGSGAQPWRAFWYLVTARVIVIDHEFEHPVFNLVRHLIPVIQLWHGLPYKLISGNRHQAFINDAAFISSSRWYNEQIFPDLFRAKKFLTLGHPRNDALLLPPAKRPFSDALTYESWQQFARSCERYLVYMPTYRDSGDNHLPMPLDPLQQWLASQNIRLILKLHPFVTDAVGELAPSEQGPLPVLKGYSHIHVFPAKEDIYPWLGSAAMLLTDYSSVIYDFLLCDKPIVYYQYDDEEYVKTRGKPLVSEAMFLAGEKVVDEAQLLPWPEAQFGGRGSIPTIKAAIVVQAGSEKSTGNTRNLGVDKRLLS